MLHSCWWVGNDVGPCATSLTNYIPNCSTAETNGCSVQRGIAPGNSPRLGNGGHQVDQPAISRNIAGERSIGVMIDEVANQRGRLVDGGMVV